MIKPYHLSRIEIKIILLRIADVKCLPKDIIRIIYNIIEKEKQKENQIMIHFTEQSLYNKLTIWSKDNCDTSQFIPDKKGIEWLIKAKNTQVSMLNDGLFSARKYLMFQINIIGEENYLFEENGNGLINANKKTIYNYLNTNPYIEVIEGYINYKEYKGTPHETLYRLII